MGCCVRILYSEYSVAKLCIGQADKSHCHLKDFTATLIFILPLTDGHVFKGGGGVRMGVYENQCDKKILQIALDLLAWPIHSLATLYPVYNIRTEQPHS